MTDKKQDKKISSPTWADLRDSGLFDPLFEKLNDDEKQFIDNHRATIAEASIKLTDALRGMLQDKETYNELARRYNLPEKE